MDGIQNLLTDYLPRYSIRLSRSSFDICHLGIMVESSFPAGSIPARTQLLKEDSVKGVWVLPFAWVWPFGSVTYAPRVGFSLQLGIPRIVNLGFL